MTAPSAPPPFSPPLAPVWPGGCECSQENQDLKILPWFGSSECDWSSGPRIILYSFSMIYFFYAVGLVANTFMEAIEVITSKKKLVKNPRTGATEEIQVWNPTVANLTLMALGSSAPEILLAIIETLMANFYAGELGPGTIVGSAAFNLLMIVGICIVAIPKGQVRRIEQLGVFVTTACCSLFAYFWLYLVLRVFTPNKVEIWEASLTLIFFPILVQFSYWIDKGYHLRLGKTRVMPGGGDGLHDQDPGWASRAVKQPSVLGVDEAVSLVKALRANDRSSGDVTEEEIAQLGQALKPKTRSEHRRQSMAVGTGGMRRGSTMGVGMAIDMSPEAIAAARARVFKPDTLIEEEEPSSPDEGKRVSSTSSADMPVRFETSKYRVSEKEGKVLIHAILVSEVDKPVTICYTTRDPPGPQAAKAGTDYVHTEGTLTFAVGEKRKEISVGILDDDEVEQDEYFEIGLANPTATQLAGGDPKKAEFDWSRTCKVIIIDDDRPGFLSWEVSEAVYGGGAPAEAELYVVRQDGNRGDIAFKVVTVDETAAAGKDFMAISEVRTMRNGASDMAVRVPITTKDAAGNPKQFSVRLVEAKQGEDGHEEPPAVIGKDSTAVVKLTGNAPGGGSSSGNDAYGKNVADIINAQLQEEEARTYSDQFNGIWYPEVEEKATPIDWILHIPTVPWKALFATIPPPTMGGGWPCFGTSLAYIGGVTLFIQEIATLFGCGIGMSKSCNAVIFVALGTSLPDALASQSAAVNDLTADASVGNVTGSNCVNVFLGLGLPWLVSSIYFKIQGPTDKWRKKYPDSAAKYPDGGFIVEGEDLGFAVMTFIGVAVIAFGILFLRRIKFGGELGGPVGVKRASAILFAGMWVLFVTMYCTLADKVTI